MSVNNLIIINKRYIIYMDINKLEIHNRYAKVYTERVQTIIPASIVRKSVDSYEKFIPLIPLMENPIVRENDVINWNKEGIL